MKQETTSTIYLKDYHPPEHIITRTELDITLGFQKTTVRAIHQVSRKNSEADELILDCELMTIESVSIDGTLLNPERYQQHSNQLIIPHDANQFTLEIVNHISPTLNTALSGLYQSGDMLCTQCEAEGFRRITPSVDRPDNLALYTVTLRANHQDFPVLLCNGNLVDSGPCSDDRFDGNGHFTTWHDPFPKPTYLFAIVAGKLDCLEDTFMTRSGKEVTLKFLARDKDIEKCHHAMSSLKKSMTWDEEVYGREYDLDIFHVVAVSDFNMGAMENKSLNIFNTKYVLANPKMATDMDFQNVESVIGHEYFHNWSGNRVTCRDWFQLSLKEGFTVFRDQEFSADMGSRGVKRIEDVDALRVHQFKEDAGPMAHPVRPASYQEINNFYTATVYNKGAEVVRMLHTLIGAEKFRQGCDLYFERHDGEAVTTDDFVAALESVTGQDLTQFKRWYSQAGTPVVEVEAFHDDQARRLILDFKQHCPPTPGQEQKQPFVVPVKMALFDQSGNKITLGNGENEQVLMLTESEQRFVFDGIDSEPIPSLLRGFSAPVQLIQPLNDEQLACLLIHDDDPFNRWEAAQKLYMKQILINIRRYQSGEPLSTDEHLKKAFVDSLNDHQADPMFLAKLLTLPSEIYIGESIDPIDPEAISASREHVKSSLALAAKDALLTRYNEYQEKNSGAYTTEEVAYRALRNTCLSFLTSLDEPTIDQLCIDQLDHAKCMTDSSSAITALSSLSGDSGKQKLADFYEEWKDEELVVDKWLRCQATSSRADTLDTVKDLTAHRGFDYTNPNKVYSLLMAFSHGNPKCFHAEDGSGYKFLTSWVKKLDPVNPQVTARLVSALNNWKKYKPSLKDKMQSALEEISELPNLSRDVAEIVNKSLHS